MSKRSLTNEPFDAGELERAQEHFRLVVEASPSAMLMVNKEGTITLVNKQVEQLFGYSREELIGQRIELLVPERYRAVHPSHRHIFSKFPSSRAMSAGRGLCGRRKDGSEAPIEIGLNPIETDEGSFVLASIIDITERKLVEEALQGSELRYRRLFESAKDGILILDGDSGQIVDVNPYLTDMLGFSKDELVGKRLWEIGPFKDIVASKIAFVKLQQEGYIRYDNLPLESREGLVRQVEVVSNSYLAGESRVFQCNIRDITGRKRVEEELRQTNQQLEKALADLLTKTAELASMTQQLWQASKLTTMGELSASVAHELNNPLATISLHAEMLLGQLAADDHNRRSLLVISQEVERMATLVSNLLQFSRRTHKQVSTLDICEELTNSLDFIQFHLSSNDIDIVKDYATVLPAFEADRQQLHQVFLNLISNASDAMPQGGTLTVRIRLGTMANGQPAVVIEFSDTGTGVQTDDLSKLWEPFFTTKPPGKGTGLGLAICRRIVEEHRGTIEIETGPGKGTTVRITLPTTDARDEVTK